MLISVIMNPMRKQWAQRRSFRQNDVAPYEPGSFTVYMGA